MLYITLLGLFLRLTYIIKPEGLWNDEYVSFMVASTPFGSGFTDAILKQCHMPLYYFYLKPFTECSDSVLRLTSVFPSVLAIPVMYFLGKEYSKKVGVLASAITSVLSFLVYYAQEVRFYSLLFLLSALSLLFTVRIIKNSNKKNLFLWVCSNILILLTHVLGIIYVFFNMVYVIYKKRDIDKKAIVLILLCGIFAICSGFYILNHLPSSQWWGHFSYTNILFLFSDFLSPVLTNHINAPSVFLYSKNLALWLTAPTVIGIVGIIAGIKKNEELFGISLGVIIIMSLLAVNGKIVFVTKYATEILPILIILLANGFVRMKKFGLFLCALFFAFHAAAFFTPNYVTKTYRAEGHGIVGELINARAPQNVIYTYYAPERFLRYINVNAKTYSISKINRFEYVNNPAVIFDNIKKGETVSVVFLDSVSFFSEEYLEKNGKYIPEMFVTFSHIKNNLISYLNDNYQDFIVDKKGAWTVITAKRK